MELTCQRCGNTLQVADSVEGKWLTCPRCLASVRNPNADRVTSTPSQGQVQPAPRPRYQAPSIERDTRGDTAATGALLIILGLVGFVFFLMVLCGGGFQGRSLESLIGLIVGVGFLLIVIVIVGIALGSRSRDPRARASTGVAGGVVTGLIGALATGLIVAILTVMAIFAAIAAFIGAFIQTCKCG
jgi:hypothetical protein